MRSVTRDRPLYLEKVRDIRVDLVNDSNAIAEDSCSLIGMQSGLDKMWNAHGQYIAAMSLGLGELQGVNHTSNAGYSCRESSMVIK